MIEHFCAPNEKRKLSVAEATPIKPKNLMVGDKPINLGHHICHNVTLITEAQVEHLANSKPTFRVEALR